MVKNLDLKKHLGHSVGTVGEAIEARNSIAELLGDHIGARVTNIGNGFETYDSAYRAAITVHHHRKSWVYDLFQSEIGEGHIILEDGGIKSEQSVVRKIGNDELGFRVTNDFSRLRLVANNLQTLIATKEKFLSSIEMPNSSSCLHGSLNRYGHMRSDKTLFSGYFLRLVDSDLRPYLEGEIDDNLKSLLIGIIDQARKISGRWLIDPFEEQENLTLQQKNRLQHLEQEYQRAMNFLERSIQDEVGVIADYSILTEVQIVTQRVRHVMEDNRNTYAKLSGRQRKGEDFTEYNKSMLRAILLDWKEYFAQK